MTETWFLTINECHLEKYCKLRLHFGGSYLKAPRRETLSPLPSLSGTRWKIFESTTFGYPLYSSFNFDGRLEANNGDGCMTFATSEWSAALGAKPLSIRDIFTRVWCLASGAKTRVAGTFIYDFKHRLNVTNFSFGASSIGTELGFSRRRYMTFLDQLELVVRHLGERGTAKLGQP